jgi:hypothetical protein
MGLGNPCEEILPISTQKRVKYLIPSQISYMDAERWCVLKGRLWKNVGATALDFASMVEAITKSKNGL